MVLCPICDCEIDEDKHRIKERLATLGYLHVDVWLRCPNCGYAPCFGRELQDTKPIYVYPEDIPEEKKLKIFLAVHRHFRNQWCFICGKRMELHKVWINTFKITAENHELLPLDNPDKLERCFFMHDNDKMKLIESGILFQWKCINPYCKYVRYATI